MQAVQPAALRIVDWKAIRFRLDPIRACADLGQESDCGAIAGKQHVGAVIVSKAARLAERAAPASRMRGGLVERDAPALPRGGEPGAQAGDSGTDDMDAGAIH